MRGVVGEADAATAAVKVIYYHLRSLHKCTRYQDCFNFGLLPFSSSNLLERPSQKKKIAAIDSHPNVNIHPEGPRHPEGAKGQLLTTSDGKETAMLFM